MKRRFVIFGDTEFAEELCQIVKAEGIEVVAFCVDGKYMKNCTFCDLPMYPFEEIDKILDMRQVEVALALGYSQMNNVRKRKYEECKDRGFHVATFCSEGAYNYSKRIGEGSIILPTSYIGPSVEIGVCNVIKTKIAIPHHNIVGNFNWIASGSTFGGGAKIGNNCFIGLCTTVRNSIRVADYTFSAANTYLYKDTLEGCAYMGMPARRVDGKSSLDMVKNV